MKKVNKPVETRVVYVVKNQQNDHTTEAATVEELRKKLQVLLPFLSSYSLKAIAHLAHVDRVALTQSDWSVRRTGTMSFQPDVKPEEKSPAKPHRRNKSNNGAVGSLLATKEEISLSQGWEDQAERLL